MKAGIKPSGKADFAVAVADRIASAAAMFTANRVQAAPITVGRTTPGTEQWTDAGGGGERRQRELRDRRGWAARRRTGVQSCGADLWVRRARSVAFVDRNYWRAFAGEKLVAALPEVKKALRANAEGLAFAQAILTTDTRPKVASAQFEAGGKTVRIAGVCKGAGMIHPQLVPATAGPHATMLVYLFTDAAVHPTALDRYLRAAVEVSFNRISIDGDTSTNDTVLLIASGASGADVWADDADFAASLSSVCTSLAKQIVADGEGVGHVVELQIEGAPSDVDALTVAKSIAHSMLVKTAWAGADPNWGRLMAAVGYSGVEIDPEKIAIWFGALPICAKGGRAPEYDEKRRTRIWGSGNIRFDRAGRRDGRCRFWTSDLRAEYVRINAEYST